MMHVLAKIRHLHAFNPDGRIRHFISIVSSLALNLGYLLANTSGIKLCIYRIGYQNRVLKH